MEELWLQNWYLKEGNGKACVFLTGGGAKYLKPLLILKNSPANMITFNICIEKLSSDVHISSVKAFEVQRLYSFRKVNQHQFLKLSDILLNLSNSISFYKILARLVSARAVTRPFSVKLIRGIAGYMCHYLERLAKNITRWRNIISRHQGATGLSKSTSTKYYEPCVH